MRVKIIVERGEGPPAKWRAWTPLLELPEHALKILRTMGGEPKEYALWSSYLVVRDPDAQLVCYIPIPPKILDPLEREERLHPPELEG